MNLQRMSIQSSLGAPLHNSVKNRDFVQIKALLCEVANCTEDFWDKKWTQFNSTTNGTEDEFWTLSLIEYGAQVDYQDESGFSPLHYSLSHGFNEIAKILIHFGAPLETVTPKNNWTPLHLGTLRCKYETVELLILNGANRAAKSLEGETCIDLSQHSMTQHVLTKTKTKIPSLQTLLLRMIRRKKISGTNLLPKVLQDKIFSVHEYFKEWK